jgi:hypothetical protein
MSNAQTPTQNLAQALAQFNRKERYWLLRNALGQQTDADNVPSAPQLSESFRFRLGRHLSYDIPPTAWWAMDYHLDWLYAAIVLLRGNPQIHYNNDSRGIQANQEDIDFIIAFDKTLILIEAKGDTPWSNEQLSSKKARLDLIFKSLGTDFQPLAGIDKVLYVLMSPDAINWHSPQTSRNSLKIDSLPIGLDNTQVWMKLNMDKQLLKVRRCNEDGKVIRSGVYWKTEPI